MLFCLLAFKLLVVDRLCLLEVVVASFLFCGEAETSLFYSSRAALCVLLYYYYCAMIESEPAEVAIFVSLLPPYEDLLF